MDGEPSRPKKAKLAPKLGRLPSCPYGKQCIRRNPHHFKQFSHPDGLSHFSKGSHTSDRNLSKAATSTFSNLSSDDEFDDTNLPPCKYGIYCYRKNLLHFAEFSHPVEHPLKQRSLDLENPPEDSNKSVQTLGKTSSVDSALKNVVEPGNKVKSVKVRSNRKTNKEDDQINDDGSDTEVYDSSEEEKEEKKPPDPKVPSLLGSTLSTGLTLVKQFSMLTNEQRKELIKRAFEEKLRLKQELEGARKLVEEKDRKLEEMKKQVNGGKMLLLPGEEEALTADTTTFFRLSAERNYKEGSASQIHFRVAESQFYRLLTGQASLQTRITYVEYVVSPPIIKRFRQFQEKLRASRGEEFTYPVLGFHGTKQENITSICENGFLLPGHPRFQERTDCGWYGAGIYFSEYPKYSMKYIQGASKLMLSQVLPGKNYDSLDLYPSTGGPFFYACPLILLECYAMSSHIRPERILQGAMQSKVYRCPEQIHGAKLQEGFDSHTSPCGRELVIFDSSAIRPCYIIHFTTAEGLFKYEPQPTDIETDFNNALKMPPSNVFQGSTFAISGKLGVKHAELFKLVEAHGGQKATSPNTPFNILISTPDDFDSKSSKVLAAYKHKALILKVDFILQSILSNAKIPTDEFIIK